jgi:hypothetical protein
MSAATQIIRFGAMPEHHLDDQVGDHIGGYVRAANGWLTTLCDLRPI